MKLRRLMDTTLNYYDMNARTFIDQTKSADMTQTYIKFLSYLPKSAHILDFGCGSGRDTRYFLGHSYQMTSIDGSEEICKLASAYTGIQVLQLDFKDFEQINVYDAIWACASILHLPWNELNTIIDKMVQSLKTPGYIYVSFKYGEFEGYRNGRYFTDLTEQRLSQLLADKQYIEVKDLWITQDARPERENELWLNAILKK